ncbi:B-cell receptor CD22-like [Pseudophryne corroboree]|uniref:B-cell receptor CD22-like n=1 Tax=Pseudophryne corroboree TaxID=495146 RepID=UPI0030812262
MTEGIATIIRCYADHTCASRPPSLQWNKPGPTNRQSVTLSGGNWREVSVLTYIPTYVDDGTLIQCTATYHNGLRIQNEATLSIKFPPKGVTVTSVVTQGGDVYLSCGSRNSKPAVYKYEWYRGKNKTKLQDWTQRILVKNVTWDTEPFSCTAINDVGRGESALTEIPVQYAPIKVHIIQSEPKDGVTELKCDFLSSRPNVTHYSWMKDNSLLPNETGQILLVIKTEENNGIYSCIAHNGAGSSPSEEVSIEAQKADSLIAKSDLLLVILLVLGGGLLILLILVVFFYIRRKRSKSAHDTPPILGATTMIPHMMGHEQILEEHHEYGNIQTTRSPGSSDQRYEDNSAIYSNGEIMHAPLEIEYSAIVHPRPNQARQSHRHEEPVEYATVKR